MGRAILSILLLALFVAACDKPAPRGATPTGSASASTAGANAADLYRSAFGRMTKDQNLLIGGVMLTPQGATFESTAGGTLEQAFAAVKGRKDVVADLIKAGEQEMCNFALPRPTEDGPEMQQIVELSGKLRATVRLLKADAARLWMDGDTDGAVERIAAIYGMGAHLAQEQILLISLVNAAVIGVANETARTMAAGAGGRALSEAQRERLLRAIERLNGADPAGLVRARQAEATTDANLIQSLQQGETKIRQEVVATKASLRTK